MSKGRRQIDPGQGILIVGSGAGVGFYLNHPSVAPRHARIYRSSGLVWIAPLDDALTTVNKQPLTSPVSLRERDTVAFGVVEFVLEKGLLHEVVESGLGLEADGLGFEVEGRALLKGLRLSIRPGEFVALLGPSGAGKSTLLRILLGYQGATAGTVRAGLHDLPSEAEYLWERAGYVRQDDVIFPALTVREHLHYALRLRKPGITADMRNGAVDQTLTMLGLEARADQRVDSLSGGECKRLAVAQEVVTGPEILFLDEPTAGLDPANERKLIRQLRQVAASGITSICATHIMESIEEFGRVIFLFDGRIAYDGPPAGLLANFGATTYPELYDLERLRRKTPAGRLGAPCRKTDSGSPRTAASFWAQVPVLASRNLKLLWRDKGWALLLVLQPIIIGVLINLSQCQPSRIAAIPTFAMVAAVWLGLNNTARELVRDRRQYSRERLVGVTPLNYILAKWFLFVAIGVVQLVMLLVIILYLNILMPNQKADFPKECPPIALCGALLLTYLGASLVGLTVSAWVDSQQTAVALLPLLVLPQLLLTGEATGLNQNYQFQSVYHLVRSERSPEGLPWRESVREWASVPMFTRPAVALCKKPSGDRRVDAVGFYVNVIHLCLLGLLSAVALVCVFRCRERSWLAASAGRNS